MRGGWGGGHGEGGAGDRLLAGGTADGGEVGEQAGGADDVVAPHWVGAVARALEQHDLVACRLDGARLNEPAVLEIRPCPQQDGLMRFKYSDLLPFASTCGLGVRRSAFEPRDGFDETVFLGGDVDVFCWPAQLQGWMPVAENDRPA